MHVHAFSPLEVWQGAATLNMPLAEYLEELKLAGLGTLPAPQPKCWTTKSRRHLPG